MKYPVIVFTCDEHKMKDSMRFAGVFTSLTQLRKALKTMLENEDIEYSVGGNNEISDFTTYDDFSNYLEYVYLEEINLNELING